MKYITNNNKQQHLKTTVTVNNVTSGNKSRLHHVKMTIVCIISITYDLYDMAKNTFEKN